MNAKKQPAQRANRMTLGNAIRGRISLPVKILAYGTEGVGKSTFAADAPAPIFLCSEDGTAQLDITRFPEPRDWQDVVDAVRTLLEADHDRKTFVVDTLDWLEPLCWEYVCHENGWKDIEAPGYGKGYVPATDQWRMFLRGLDALRVKRGMHVVLLAHAQVKQFNNPEGENYDRFELKLQKSASGLVREWCEDVLFCSFEEFAVMQKSGKAKGVSDGSRIMRTEKRAAFDAKNRHGLPFQLPLSWDEYWTAVGADGPERAEELRGEIQALVAGTSVEAKAANSVKLAGDDVRKLAQILDYARGRINQEVDSGEEAA